MRLESRNKQFGFKRFLRSFTNSLSGLKYAYLHEQSMFIHLIATILTIILGIILKISRVEAIVLASLLCFVAVIELLNTAIEACCDSVTLDINPLIKIAKDTASCAVFLGSIVTLIISLVIFVPKILELIR